MLPNGNMEITFIVRVAHDEKKLEMRHEIFGLKKKT